MSAQTVLDVVLDGVVDTLKLIPFLFCTYLAMEALEHAASGKSEEMVSRAGAFGPLVGGILGALPQCGFSTMAATLFAGRVIGVGTLVAVILSTSDEMIPVFVAHAEPVSRLLRIVGLKVCVGIAAGFVTDWILRLFHKTGDGRLHIDELCEAANCGCDETEDEEGGGTAPAPDNLSEAGDVHGHVHAGGRGRQLWPIVRSALVHTAQVTFFILLVTIAFGFVIEGVGTDAIGQFLGTHPVRAALLSALVGLIPNCAASVVISELYLSQALSLGVAMAGLLCSGGLGLLVLFRTNRNLAQNLSITALIYVTSVATGLVIDGLGIIF